MARPWIAFFSQTGSEIVDIIDKLGKHPSIIITNHRPNDVRKINENIPYYSEVANKPDLKQLEFVCGLYENPIITLHGWLRIMPPEICNKYEIYNGHPGLITKYPELKGKDPQEKAFNLKHKVMGCVLHEVSPGVDEGKILMEERFNSYGLDLNGVFRTLRDRSLYMWINFLRVALINRNYFYDN